MSSSATNSPISTDQRSGVLVITIDRVEAGNSISLETALAMRQQLAGLSRRSGLRGIVITGAGSKFFCAGGDLKAYRSIKTKEELARTFGAVRELLDDIEKHDLPVVAAINGYALGGGAELALACDMRFASASAKIGFPQSRLGLIPGWSGTERLVGLIGSAKSMRLLLTAEQLTATQALSEGLVDAISEACVVDHAVTFLAGLSIAPLAFSAVKRAVRASTLHDQGGATDAIFEELWFTEDHREAELAFSEKRPPIYHGR